MTWVPFFSLRPYVYPTSKTDDSDTDCVRSFCYNHCSFLTKIKQALLFTSFVLDGMKMGTLYLKWISITDFFRKP